VNVFWGSFGRWIWIGISRTIAAFSLLSLMFGETWARGWLAWFLKHWADAVHVLGLQLPIHLRVAEERSLALLSVLVGIAVSERFIGKRKVPEGSASTTGTRIFLFLKIVTVVLACFLTFENWAVPWWWGNFRYFWIGLVVLLWAIDFGPRASLITVGIVAALLAINYGANLFGIAPPPRVS